VRVSINLLGDGTMTEGKKEKDKIRKQEQMINLKKFEQK
jgi:hypothetical protein